MNYLIIGAGAASLSAATTLRRTDPASRITILSRETVSPYARMALPYVLAGKFAEKDLFLTPPPGVSLLSGEEAVRIHGESRTVETASGKNFYFDRLLIASGATPEKPKIPGGNLPFVFTVRHLPDIVGIQACMKAGARRIIIAGAGPVSMETGDALREMGMSITFIVTSANIFSTMLDPPAAGWLAGKLREKGIEILTGEEIVGIREDGTVALRSGATRECDLVIFGKGVKPDIPFLAGSGIAAAQGIEVNEKQETNLPGVYAAGDAAQSRDIVSGGMRINALWPVAVEQGRVAALNMAGVPAIYPGSFARNILRVFGISIFTAGAGRTETGCDIRTAAGDDFYRKIVVDRGILKGLIFLGEVRNEGFYSSLIAGKQDVSACAGSLLKGSYGYGRRLAQVCRLAP
ncbi:MAG: FAD-dependent oxidoreductase [Deltaproteobacteria bacterium]|nr:FAD-dependent oxidoreductase [Deltaproteobacteria bacterium]